MGRYLFSHDGAPTLGRAESFGFVHWIQTLPHADAVSYEEVLSTNGVDA